MLNDLLIILLAGFTTGITTVLFGFGGGFVVVPFVYQLLSRQPGLSTEAMHIAVATSTAVMIFNAGWVSFRNWRSGKLSPEILFPLVWFIAIGAVEGSWLVGVMSEEAVREAQVCNTQAHQRLLQVCTRLTIQRVVSIR